MKIGVFEFAIDQSTDPAVLAKRAEELGFASFWVPEHPVIPIKTSTPYPGSADGIIPDAYGRILDPFVALARVSGATKTIQLGTGICLIPERNPLLLAKEVATLRSSFGWTIHLWYRGRMVERGNRSYGWGLCSSLDTN